MGAAAAYFQNIKEAVLSIFEGMAVSGSHFMRKPYTVQYPDRTATRVQDTLPFRYRGILEVDLEICTGCLACGRACPIDCIVITAEKDPITLIKQKDIYELLETTGDCCEAVAGVLEAIAVKNS